MVIEEPLSPQIMPWVVEYRCGDVWLILFWPAMEAGEGREEERCCRMAWFISPGRPWRRAGGAARHIFLSNASTAAGSICQSSALSFFSVLATWMREVEEAAGGTGSKEAATTSGSCGGLGWHNLWPAWRPFIYLHRRGTSNPASELDSFVVTK